jgi:hypothetical protein
MPQHERVAYRTFVARTQTVRNELPIDGVVSARSLHLPEPKSAGIGVEFQVMLGFAFSYGGLQHMQVLALFSS